MRAVKNLMLLNTLVFLNKPSKLKAKNSQYGFNNIFQEFLNIKIDDRHSVRIIFINIGEYNYFFFYHFVLMVCEMLFINNSINVFRY